MSDLLEIAHVLLALSIPFMLGMIAGRGIRKDGPTSQHTIGQYVIDMTEEVRSKRQFIGSGFVVKRTGTIKFPDGRNLVLEVREDT